MKETILDKTAQVFLKFGFKSVTMDDIASQLAISKKTLYKYFSNKQDLIDQAVTKMHTDCLCSINQVTSLDYNAIHENFEIKKIFKELLNNIDTSPMYQLQKYYPKTYAKLMNKEFLLFKDSINKNINKGIREGLYRSDIDIDLITRLYFTLIMAVHDYTVFGKNEKTINQLEINALEYHTRAIATPKGIKELEKQLNQLNNN